MFIRDNGLHCIALEERPFPQPGIVNETTDITSIAANANLAEAEHVVDDSSSMFDKLRGAMSGGNTSLFEPLQSALDHLVKLGYSNVSSLELT